MSRAVADAKTSILENLASAAPPLGLLPLPQRAPLPLLMLPTRKETSCGAGSRLNEVAQRPRRRSEGAEMRERQRRKKRKTSKWWSRGGDDSAHDLTHATATSYSLFLLLFLFFILSNITFLIIFNSFLFQTRRREQRQVTRSWMRRGGGERSHTRRLLLGVLVVVFALLGASWAAHLGEHLVELRRILHQVLRPAPHHTQHARNDELDCLDEERSERERRRRSCYNVHVHEEGVVEDLRKLGRGHHLLSRVHDLRVAQQVVQVRWGTVCQSAQNEA